MEEEFFGFEDTTSTVSSEECKIVASNRGGLKLLHKGFIYHRDKQVINIESINNS